MLSRVLGVWMALALLDATASFARAADTELPTARGLGDLRVGHWVRAKGALDSGGTFVASEIEIVAPEDDETLIGTATGHPNPTRFYVLGQEVHVDAKTTWSGLAAGNPEGVRVKVSGRYRGPRNFSADLVQRRAEGRDRIEGRIDRLDHQSGGATLRIMGFEVFASTDVAMESEAPLEQVPLASERIFATGLAERDDDDDIRGSIQLGPDVTFGGQIELSADAEDEFDLDDGKDQDRRDLELALRGELVWEPNDHFYFLGGFRHRDHWRYEEEEPDQHTGTTVLTEAYGYWRDAFGAGFDLQIGRQDFDEEREWIYDQNLDAVRLIKSWSRARLELSASTVLSDGSPRDEDTLNWMAYLSNGNYDRHAALWVLHRAEAADEQTTHLGARVYGDWLSGQEIWADGAYLFGESEGADLSSFGYDVGTTLQPDFLGPLNVTLGYAWGAGDNDLSDSTDGNFLQTGLNDNNAKFGGVTSFRYYGELLEPELSNLGIWTLGVGTRIGRRSSIDLVWHKYDQVEALPFFSDAGIDKKPNGIDADIGWEADVIVGTRALGAWQLEVVAGTFEPGAAFPADAERAWVGKLQVRFSF